jgi:hypothetical protein
MTTPFVVLGDAPFQSTGLSRILTDVVSHLVDHQDALGIDVRTVGWTGWQELPRQGVGYLAQDAAGVRSWPGWAFNDFGSRGGPALHAAWRHWFGGRKGIVLTIWDPARVEAVAMADLPIDRWGYFAVDATTPTGGITGPPQHWLGQYQRIAAYTRFGGEWLLAGLPHRRIAVLPHGLNPQWVAPVTAAGLGDVLPYFPDDGAVIGTVATNTRRKDWGVVAATLAQLPGYWGWWHTNRTVGEAWSLPQLIADYGLSSRVVLTTPDLTGWGDAQLLAAYTACAATFAPGRGEGWGYPIMESQAAGRPAIHPAYAGGAEVAHPADLIHPGVLHPEGPYAQLRPMVDPSVVAEAIRRVVPHPSQLQPTQQVARRRIEHVEQFLWARVWPAWQSWIEDGLAVPYADRLETERHDG